MRPAFNIAGRETIASRCAALHPGILIDLLPSPSAAAEELSAHWHADHHHVPVTIRAGAAGRATLRETALTLACLSGRFCAADKILVFCGTGISHAPGAVLILDVAWDIAAGMHSETSVEQAVRRLRTASPGMAPSPSLVAAGDEILGLRGALTAALGMVCTPVSVRHAGRGPDTLRRVTERGARIPA